MESHTTAYKITYTNGERSSRILTRVYQTFDDLTHDEIAKIEKSTNGMASRILVRYIRTMKSLVRKNISRTIGR